MSTRVDNKIKVSLVKTKSRAQMLTISIKTHEINQIFKNKYKCTNVLQ